MGLFLMRESMDEVAFYNLGPEGKETHLTKFLPRRNIEEYLNPAERSTEPPPIPETPTPAAPPGTVEKIPYRVRRMHPRRLSKCLGAPTSLTDIPSSMTISTIPTGSSN
jgi:hypothetical protein